MSRLISNGNIAIFEYPKVEEPNFDLDTKGVLFITGYKINIGEKEINSAKRFELGLENYTVIGKYDYAKKVIEGNFISVFSDVDFDSDNSVVLIKNN